jgi:hypothetical protein
MRNQSVHSRHQSILARHQTVQTRHRGISQGTLVAGAKRGMSQSKRGMQSAKQSIHQTINQSTDHSQCYINKSISQSINHKRGKSRACPQTCDNHGNRWYADSSLAVDDEEGVVLSTPHPLEHRIRVDAWLRGGGVWVRARVEDRRADRCICSHYGVHAGSSKAYNRYTDTRNSDIFEALSHDFARREKLYSLTS